MLTAGAVPKPDIGWFLGIYVCMCSVGEGLERGADGKPGTQTTHAAFSGSHLGTRSWVS